MYNLAESQDSRIAQYTFGKSIAQFGVSVFSCNNARKGKKVFGNDPDPTTRSCSIHRMISYLHI